MKQIPLIDAKDPVDLFDRCATRAERLRHASTIGLAGLLSVPDRVSRDWLARNDNPFLDELDEIAAQARGPGIYSLNTVYEWCCTSAIHLNEDDTPVLFRILDWGLPGIGEGVVIAKHQGAAGPWHNITWPGTVGVLTCLCEGRFSAAINQAPQHVWSGMPTLDTMAGWGRVWRHGGIPAAHLLRQACETALGFDDALAMLTDSRIQIAQPAFFILAGTRSHEACIIERFGTQARIHRQDLAVANDWLSPDLPGRPRGAGMTAQARRQDCAHRRATILNITTAQATGFAWVRQPILNRWTKLAVTCDATSGQLNVQAYEPKNGTPVPVATFG